MHFLKLSLFSIILLFSLLTTGHVGVVASSRHHHHHRRHAATTEHHQLQQKEKLYTKLFVFGDSYADTGNNRKSIADSWKQPYGVTFPGKPAGRFSDGRVLTDYIAKHLGIKSPVPYKFMKYVGPKRLHEGINFAYGGTGVFDTLSLDPNMTTQIDFFQNLITHTSLYNKTDLQSSLALLTVSGNDYSAYLALNGSAAGMPNFIASVVNQIAVNLKRIQGLGVRKIAVTGLQPLGCLPRSTILNSFQRCNDTENTAVSLHNLLLQQAVAKLNNDTKNSNNKGSSIFIIDLYSSFTTVLLDTKSVHSGNLKFETPLKACCMGISQEYSCGDVNEKGQKMYTVCNDPQSSFFWDMVHPTQGGWQAVYNVLEPVLETSI